MSYLSFIFNAYWRESGTVGKSIQLTLVSIPLLASAIFAFIGGEWSRDMWPWWVWICIAITAAILSVGVGITRRAFKLENDAQPKFHISPAFDDEWTSSNTTAVYQHMSEVVTKVIFTVNNPSSTKSIDNIEVTLKSITEDGGKKDYVLKRLKPNDREKPSFSLNPGTNQIFELAKIKQLSAARDEYNEFCLGPFSDATYINVPPLPTTLEIQIGGQNMPQTTATFRIQLNERNILTCSFSPM